MINIITHIVKKMTEEIEITKKVNVRDWIVLSSTMIGAVLTILALIWQARPTNGIVTATFLLLLSFILFVNSVSSNSKAHFEVESGNSSEQRINKWISFAEYSFGFGFTLVISGFSILGYEYLKDFTNHSILSLLLPVVLLFTAWIMIMIYNMINYEGKPLKSFRSFKRNLWMILELGVLATIFFDYIGLILIL